MSIVREKFGVVYSDSWMRRVLKKGGFHFAKPYLVDYRRPGDSNLILKSLENALDGREDMVVGFLDECSSQTHNSVRLWS